MIVSEIQTRLRQTNNGLMKSDQSEMFLFAVEECKARGKLRSGSLAGERKTSTKHTIFTTWSNSLERHTDERAT